MSFVDVTDKYVRREVVEILLYIVIGIIMMGLLPLGVGLIGKAFEGQFAKPLNISTYLGQYVVYYIFIIIALFVPIFTIGKLILLKKGEHISELKNPRWWHIFTVSYIFAPEENGALYYLSEKSGFKGNRNLFRWTKSIFRIFIIFILIFSFIFLLRVAFPKQLAFIQGSDLPQITVQQITVLSEIIFTTEPASFGETFTLLFLFMLLMGINGYICAKFKLGKTGFFLIGIFLVPFLLSGIWGFMHGIIYGNSSVSFTSTLIFGFVGSLLTTLFGTGWIFYIFHFVNNSMSKIQEIVTVKEDILFIGFIIWGLILISYIILEIYLHSKKKKIGEDTYFANAN